MLWTGLFTLFAVLAAAFSAVCAYRCAQNLAGAAALRASHARITRFEQELVDQRALYEALFESHKRLRSREGMRELRQRQAMEQQPTDPLAWKRQMRAQLAAQAAQKG